MSLLEKAKAYKPARNHIAKQGDREHIELAAAFFRGEINGSQYAIAAECDPRNAAAVAGPIIRAAVIDGKLSIVSNQP